MLSFRQDLYQGKERGVEVFAWMWHKRAVFLFVVIEANLLFALWPNDNRITILLIGRIAVGSLAWWYAWSKVWRRAILRIHGRHMKR